MSDAASTRSAPTNLAPIGPAEDDDDEEEDEDDTGPEESVPMRRRGKLRRKKRKCRRGSIYGQQTEVREPPEPLETQVSQIDEGSRRGSYVLAYYCHFLTFSIDPTYIHNITMLVDCAQLGWKKPDKPPWTRVLCQRSSTTCLRAFYHQIS